MEGHVGVPEPFLQFPHQKGGNGHAVPDWGSWGWAITIACPFEGLAHISRCP